MNVGDISSEVFLDREEVVVDGARELHVLDF